MNKISMDKKYKLRNGLNYQMLKTGIKKTGSFYTTIGVVTFLDGAEDTITHTDDGKFSVAYSEHDNDLIEVSPYGDFKIDDKVIVWDNVDDKVKGYFAGVNEDGMPLTFLNGKSSFTSLTGKSVPWDNCELYKEE